MSAKGSLSRRPQQILEAQWWAADDALRDALGRFATQSRFEEEFINAFCEFWGVDDPEELPIDLEEETPEFLLTFEWYLHDYCESESGKRMIDLFSDVEGSRLPPLEQTLLAQWRQATLALYEVLAVKPGAGYRVRNVLQEAAELEVDDIPTSEELKVGDLLVARLLSVGSRHRPSSVFRTFGPADLPRLKAMVAGWYADYRTDNPDASMDAFLRDEGFLFNDYALERQALADRLAQKAAGQPLEEHRLDDLSAEGSELKNSDRALAMLEAEYRAWLSRPSPILGNRSPLEASRTPGERDQMMSLLASMGQIEASYALAGEPAFEVATLLRELGFNPKDFE